MLEANLLQRKTVKLAAAMLPRHIFFDCFGFSIAVHSNFDAVKSGHVSRNFTAAIHDQVSSNFAAAKNGTLTCSSSFAEENFVYDYLCFCLAVSAIENDDVCCKQNFSSRL